MANFKVFTVFAKAIKGGLGLSFAPSAGENCSLSCRLRDACYASRIERIYSGLSVKLRRHYVMGPIAVLRGAMLELPQRIPWLRFCVDCGLPARGDMSAAQWREYSSLMRWITHLAMDRGAKIHLPVESHNKARSYRAMIPDIVVRRSSQVSTIAQLRREKDPRSWVVARRIHNGCVTQNATHENIELARQYAQLIRASGQTCVVCPAIAGNSKCGQCTACADSRVSVVLYPFHA